MKPSALIRASLSGCLALLGLVAVAHAAQATNHNGKTPVTTNTAKATTNTVARAAAVTTNTATVTVGTTNTVSTNAVSLASAVGMDTLDDIHKLAVGDRLSLRIVEDQEEPKAVMVADSGDIEVMQIGRFPAKDKTCRQLARELKAELEKDYYYQATVIIAVDQLSRTRGRVYLMGAVRMPGPQEIITDEVFTVGKAVMRAGGFAEYADKKHAKITRKPASGKPENQVFIVNVGDIIEKGRTSTDIRLEPDDLIFIPSRVIGF